MAKISVIFTAQVLDIDVDLTDKQLATADERGCLDLGKINLTDKQLEQIINEAVPVLKKELPENHITDIVYFGEDNDTAVALFRGK